jgi:hypothetical protein
VPRRRIDHASDMSPRTAARRLRSRRRRRRILGSLVKGVFWTLVLAGVFVLGLGYGRTLSSEDELRRDEVTVTVQRDAVTATLPTETVTVTRTVQARPGAPGPGRAGGAGGGEN